MFFPIRDQIGQRYSRLKKWLDRHILLEAMVVSVPCALITFALGRVIASIAAFVQALLMR